MACRLTSEQMAPILKGATELEAAAMTVHVRARTFVLLVSPLLLVAAAYIQWGTVGLPPVPSSPALTVETVTGPHGFPAWLRITHYVNFLFVILLIRSGLQILMDHP